MLALDHRVGAGVVPLFDGAKRAESAIAAPGLIATHQRRIVMLDRVIALPPEGAGDDYADGMSDTLGPYGGKLLSSRCTGDVCADTCEQLGQHDGLVRVRATQAKVNAAFGGGESRPATLPPNP